MTDKETNLFWGSVIVSVIIGYYLHKLDMEDKGLEKKSSKYNEGITCPYCYNSCGMVPSSEGDDDD